MQSRLLVFLVGCETRPAQTQDLRRQIKNLDEELNRVRRGVEQSERNEEHMKEEVEHMQVCCQQCLSLSACGGLH